MSPKVLKFSPFYFCKFVCWAHEVPGEECEDLSLYSHISLGSTSQQTVEQPKWVWDAFGTHKDILNPCCPQQVLLEAIGTMEELHGQAGLWQGLGGRHPEQQGLGLPGGRAEELMEQRHTVEGVVDPRSFSIQCLWSSCETMCRGVWHLSGTTPGLLSSGHRNHLQPEQKTLPHGHSTWLQLSFPLK